MPKTVETPSPMREASETGPDGAEREAIPSTLPGTDRLIPKTAPPPARDTAPEEPPTDQPPEEDDR